MKLTKKTITAIRNSNKVIGMLQDALGKSYTTIIRYLDDNDIMLTTTAALTVIESELDIPMDEAVEKETAKK